MITYEDKTKVDEIEAAKEVIKKNSKFEAKFTENRVIRYLFQQDGVLYFRVNFHNTSRSNYIDRSYWLGVSGDKIVGVN